VSLALWAGVALLGGVGAVLRFSVDWLVSLRFGFRFPYGILVVNVSGAFLLGVFSGAAVHAHAYLLAGAAVLGSYTTFSTWMLDTQELDARGQRRGAAVNLALSSALGLAAAALGHAVGAQL
jgi:CrcB protein